MRQAPTNAPKMRTANRAAILGWIQQNNVMTRPDLAQKTGLTPTTVSDLTRQMIKEGLILPTGTGKSAGGRRPEELGLNPAAGHVVGIDLEEVLTIVILDFAANCVYRAQITLGEHRQPNEVLAIIDGMYRKAINILNISPHKILGAGFSVPGLVDTDQGVAAFLPHLNWRGVEVRTRLSKILGVEVLVENEARATVMAEQWLGHGKQTGDFICFNVKTGIGSGIVTHGILYRGVCGTAGEVGHTTILVDGPLCSCGNRGCLEAVASTKGLLMRAKNQLGESISLAKLAERARQGEPRCLDLLKENGIYLGIGLANLVNILNPELIILERDLLLYADLIIDLLQDVLGNKALEMPRSRVRIVPSKIGQDAPAIGAAILPLAKFFEQGGILGLT
jgi:N-acetylglucosamine repressor